MSGSELRCDAVAKAYGKHQVLTALDLTVADGTLTAVLGASGDGKTTLLRIIMGLIAPDAGSISMGDTLLCGPGARHVPAHRRGIGYVAQEGALFPHLTVAGNVAFGLSRSERKRTSGTRIGEMLELVGLSESYRDRHAGELSGGEQRRVALARALAPRPTLLLLDEPFSGLDAALRVEVREAVLQALGAQRTTALLVTHDQAEALSMGHEVAVLRDGRLVQHASPAEIYRAPVDLRTARFVGDAVVLPGHAHGDAVLCALGELPVSPGSPDGPVSVMIRPEQIVIAEPGPGTADARLLDAASYGPDTVMRLTLRDGEVVRCRTFARHTPQAGERVSLRVCGPVLVYAAQRPSADVDPLALPVADVPR